MSYLEHILLHFRIEENWIEILRTQECTCPALKYGIFRLQVLCPQKPFLKPVIQSSSKRHGPEPGGSLGEVKIENYSREKY